MFTSSPSAGGLIFTLFNLSEIACQLVFKRILIYFILVERDE